MSYTATMDTFLPIDADDEKLVEDWRSENPRRSDQIRADLQQNPDRRSHLITLV
jgi:hypothetical protein